MLHTWKVLYLSREGKVQEHRHISATDTEAMEAVRDQIPNVIIVGSVQIHKLSES